ncbi:hypothetical protein K493DRAFT_95680 [Basidiobolus meristosporus CBS 931.73]|uniref:Uncharacterized protein n=1 Tax=Basidiobolus meristosporus CBS 931.73 TaxID=1314790 RepID=A0A1Y1X6F3_9FUNG|nr:hypothetical protein K493DRAFT_95680 [Basidiobolus meristosporus CBS 931.73]|eukprot:ORX81258.1 hypothetical protein K493DRAFT_95680 [Basidiobolus meristosporus CBS 931.73]
MLSFKRKVSTFFDKESQPYARQEYAPSQESIHSPKMDYECAPPLYISDLDTWVASYPVKDLPQCDDLERRPYSIHQLLDEDQWSCEGVYHTEKGGLRKGRWYSKLRNTLTPTRPLRLTPRPPAYTEMRDAPVEEPMPRKTRGKFPTIKKLRGFGKKKQLD